MLAVSHEQEQKRRTFFNFLFEGSTGVVCIAIRKAGTRIFQEEFFHFPEQLDSIVEYTSKFASAHDVYFCPQVLLSNKRSKEEVKECPTVWADLDGCLPSKMIVPPSIVAETSPGRYQALWKLKEPVEPVVGEDLSRRIAYHHADDGADKSGWDLTQLMRVPFTYNYKYAGTGEPPMIKLTAAKPLLYAPDDFKDYPPAKGHEYTEIPLPEQLPGTADEILQQYASNIRPLVWQLFQDKPEGDWSKALWKLELLLYEVGMSREEVFAVVQEAACNKYARDNRNIHLLWKDVCRAWFKSIEQVPTAELEGDPDALLTDEERKQAQENPGFVEEYIEWAKTLGDAAWQYHQAGAFVILSSLLAGSVRLPTSFGIMTPNLWFMILADTTLTRKTTAMDVAMDLMIEIDPDAILATDGSIEGLFTSLSMRPGRPSIFLRDEFSGLLELFTHRDYYAGMAETLTKLYDGKFQKRVLRREVIEVRNPILVMFAGGIRTRILELLNYDFVSSGFIPRFVFITAESDISKLRPLGPPTEATLGKRDEIVRKLTKMKEHYHSALKLTVEGKTIQTGKIWDATLTPEAWARYNRIESSMLSAGLKMFQSELMTPTFDRLSKSGLKVAVLLAAARQLGDTVVVEEQDVVKAFYYVEQWRGFTLEVIRNVGKSSNERQLDAVVRSIARHPGMYRSTLMQHFRLHAKETEAILSTLEQRGIITRTRSGKSEKLYTTQETERG